MTTIPERMIELLTTEINLLKKLGLIFDRERIALREFDIDAMEKINLEKKDIISNSEAVYLEREAFFEEFSIKFTGIKQKMTIDSILVFMRKNKEWETILNLFGEIEELSSRLKETANANQRLVDTALKTICGTIGSVKSALNPAKGYTSNGKESMALATGSILAGRV